MEKNYRTPPNETDKTQHKLLDAEKEAGDGDGDNHNHTDSLDKEDDAHVDCGDADGDATNAVIPSAEEAYEKRVMRYEVEQDREVWEKKIDFLLSVIGFAVDFGAFWRFPALCFKNGGGAFLIPYFVMFLFGAVPIFYLEMLIGQFHQEGAISIWKIAPIFKGVGWTTCLIAYYTAFYYEVILGWSYYYFFASFSNPLPWTSCNNSWNTEHCVDTELWSTKVVGAKNLSSPLFVNQTKAEPSFACTNNYTASFTNRYVSPSEEYFERRVLKLQLSKNGMDTIGTPQWEMSLCVLAVYLTMYFSLWKGVKTSGKVVWVTATFPYMMLFILLIRGISLPGAGSGIMYYIIPSLEELTKPQVWYDAAEQVFYSVGPGFGTHIAFASYNKFHNDCFKDCIYTAAANLLTSVFSGFVLFCYLGYIADHKSITVKDIAIEGPGLVFQVYPEAVTTLTGSTVWSLLFFIMMITLGLDSAMGGLEAAITGIKDEFRTWLKRFKWNREILTALVLGSAYIVALASCTESGIYILTVLNRFCTQPAILIASLIETVAISWCYGLDQLCKDVQRMNGYMPGIFWRLCWKFLSPLSLTFIIIWGLANAPPLEYKSESMCYLFSDWSYGLGWTVAAASLIFTPCFIIYAVSTMRGKTLKERFALAISPEWEHDEILRTGVCKRFKCKHWFSLGPTGTIRDICKATSPSTNCDIGQPD